MELGIKGKVAIITGGTTGIGLATTKLLAQEGCHVLANYFADEDISVKTIEDISSTTKTRCIASYGDISCPKDVIALFDTAIKTFGGVDFIINSAALLTKSLVADMPFEMWQRSTDVNFTGAYLMNKTAVNYFLENKKSGKIVNIVSQSAFNGTDSGHAHYAACKAGVVGLTVSLAKEVSKNGININAIAPGIVATPLTKEKIAQNTQRYKNTIPIGRISTPEDVANVALFLVSNLSSYIVGATIDVSGGMLMR